MADTAYILKDTVTQEEYTFQLKNGSLSLEPYGSSKPGSSILVSANWPSVSGIKDGQNLCAATFNKPLTELAERTNYLYDKLRVFNRNEPLATLIISDAELDRDVPPVVGDVVYFDEDRQVYSKAVANTSVNDAFSIDRTAYAVGVVIKRSGTTATIVLRGKLDMSLSGMSVLNMLEKDEEFVPGKYYLSTNEPGKITATPNGPRIYIGQFTEGDFALIDIRPRDLGEAHVHRSYLLAGKPAGDQKVLPDNPDGHHLYLGHSPEHYAVTDVEGDVFPRLVITGDWLYTGTKTYTFTIEKFDGGAPSSLSDLWIRWSCGSTEKKFSVNAFDKPYEVENGFFVSLQRGGDDDTVYSVAEDDPQKRTWVLTLPNDAAGWRSLSSEEKEKYAEKHPGSKEPCFVYNIGFDPAMQAFYPPVPAKSASLTMNGVELASERLGGNYVYSVENDSLYWFDDTWDHAPWPTNYRSRAVTVDSWEERRLVLHFIKSASNETGPVTSLRGAPGSGIRVLSCGSGSVYDVGDLMIDIDPKGDVVDDNVVGFNVVKEGSGGVFKTGPVVEKIVAGTGISISRLGKSPAGQGTVVINATNSGISGDFEEVALQNAKQDMVGMFPYIRLLGWNSGSNNTPTAFVLKFHVPYDNSNELYRVHILMSVFGTQDYVGNATRYAGIKMNYNILPDLNPVETEGGTYESANVMSDLISPDTERVLDIPVVSEFAGNVVSYKAFDPVMIHTKNDDADLPGKKYSSLGEAVPYIEECSRYAAEHSVDVVGVRPGYTVAVRVARGDVSDASVQRYTAPIGFMNMRWVLERAV